MPKASEELANARKDEIISACAKLYETMSFKDITIKDIGAATSFTRTSVYNYFETKEEIFLALLQREYELWTENLDALSPVGDGSARARLAEGLARALSERGRLLRLLAMSLYDMEQNSRIEKLVELKKAFGASISALERCVVRFCPEMNEDERDEFVFSVFPLMNGIYPYTSSTPKQSEAMRLAGLDFHSRSIYDIALPIIKKLLDV